MMRVTITTIPHETHRYPTVGDYWFDRDDVHIVVSDMNNPDYELLVAVHELVEAWLTRKRRISEERITEFDIQFEAKRPENDVSEPGDEPDAPYRDEHCIATGIERMLCGLMGISWKQYDDTVGNL